MKKKRSKLYLAVSGIAVLLGLFTLFLHKAGIFTELEFSENLSLLLGSIGGIFFLLGCGLIFYCLGFVKNWGKAAKIEEKDERNIAIRGKAAELGQIITSFINMILLVLFLVLDMNTAAYIIAGATFIQTWAFIFAIDYFQKTM